MDENEHLPEPQATEPPGWYPDPWQRAERRWWDGTAWTDRTQAAEPAVSAESVPTSTVDDLVRLLVLGGGVVLVIAAFLPWIQMTAPFVGTLSAPGIEGDGILTALLGVVALVVGFPLLQRTDITRGRALGLLIVGVLAGIVAANTVRNVFTGMNEVELAIGQVGIGLWVTLAAAAAVVGGALRELSIHKGQV